MAMNIKVVEGNTYRAATRPATGTSPASDLESLLLNSVHHVGELNYTHDPANYLITTGYAYNVNNSTIRYAPNGVIDTKIHLGNQATTMFVHDLGPNRVDYISVAKRHEQTTDFYTHVEQDVAWTLSGDPGVGFDKTAFVDAAAYANLGDVAVWRDYYNNERWNFTGASGNDVFIGGNLIDKIYGGGGNDLLVGKGGRDIISGGEGNDVLYGGSGNDYLYGGNGIDTAVFDTVANAGWTINLSTFTAVLQNSTTKAVIESDAISGVERITGSAGHDTIVGDGMSNILTGGNGHDSLAGGLGNDFLYGGLGIDKLDGGDGNDVLFGGDGIDTLLGGAGADGLNGGLGADILRGGAGLDFLEGGVGADVLDGGTEFDYAVYSSSTIGLTVSLANRALNTGEAAGDTFTLIDGIIGTAFNDKLTGDANRNILAAGLGDDVLTGGAGADAFVFQTSITRNGFSNIDTITDFNVADDTMWIENAIFTKLAAAGVLNAAFFHIGAAAADANDYINYNKATGDIFYDADGNGAGRETKIAHVTANTALTAADFFVI